MNSFVVNKSAFLSPVINIENGEMLGHSSIAIFTKKDLHMAYLVVNTKENVDGDVPQLLIPFSGVASINNYSISVWMKKCEGMEVTEMLSHDIYMQLMEAPVYKNNGIQIGKVCGAVISEEGELVSIEVESEEGKTNYTCDLLFAEDNIIVVDNGDEEDFEMESEVDSSDNEEVCSDGKVYSSLEDLVKKVSMQIAVLTDYIIDSRNEEKKNSLPTHIETETEFEEADQLTISTGDDEIICSKRENGSAESSVADESISEIYDEQETEIESKIFPADGVYIKLFDKLDVIESKIDNLGLILYQKADSPYDFADELFTDGSDDAEAKQNKDVSFLGIMRKLDCIEEKIDRLSISPFRCKNDTREIPDEIDETEDMCEQENDGIVSACNGEEINEGSELTAVSDDTSENESDDDFDDLSIDSFCLNQPKSDTMIDLDTNIHIDEFLDESESFENTKQNKECEIENTEEESENGNGTISESKDKASAAESQTTVKRNFTFWKNIGFQAFGAVLFAAGYAIMKFFKII